MLAAIVITIVIMIKIMRPPKATARAARESPAKQKDIPQGEAAAATPARSRS
jgi:hypothetical protein